MSYDGYKASANKGLCLVAILWMSLLYESLGIGLR